jgi:WD40 repeat protein
LAVSADDSRIAVGLENGSVALHSLKTNTSSSLATGYIGKIECCSFYPFKKNILVVGGHEGSISIWDINTNSIIGSKKNIHLAPVSGIL